MFRILIAANRLAVALAVIGTSLGSRPASAADYMYVSLENETIVRYDDSLATSVLVKASETVFATSSEISSALAFDTAGNLYAANIGNNTISKYDSAGVPQFAWSTPANPRFLAFVPEPSTYVLGAVATGLMTVTARRRKASGRD